MTGKPTNSGVLYVVATPMGNLEDITLRALRTLREVDLIAAEDTRHTRKLLSRNDIHTEMLSYREQNHAKASEKILQKLEENNNVALVCDAGTPGISDPGQALISLVILKGYKVIPIPGPAACIAALCASGLPTDNFVFFGFLPRKQSALKKMLEAWQDFEGTMVIYESPRRLGKTLLQLAELLGERQAVVAREITKIHETLDRGTLFELGKRYQANVRGEIVLMVAGAVSAKSPGVSVAKDWELLLQVLSGEKKLIPAEITRLVSGLSGISRKTVYEQLFKR